MSNIKYIIGGVLDKAFCNFVNMIFGVFVIFSWTSGVVYAQGFWSNLCAVFFPFWAWYLVIEKIII